MIKVLHTEWSDGWGGQEIRIINEMLAVKEKGVEVYLACRENAKIKQKAKENNIQVFTLPFSGSFDIKTVLGLKKIIKKYNINIVNTHSGKDTWVGGFAAKLAGVKFIRTRHLSNKINPSRLNFINELADFIFTTGESVREAMIKDNRIDPKKIISIPTGIDEKKFNPNLYTKSTCRDIFDIEQDSFVIGILAVLRGFKRHDIFLNIAKRAIEEFPQKKLKFVIAGDGPGKSRIKEIIVNLNLSQYVKMLGHVEKTPEFLKSLDMFVLTSDRNEGVPQSLMQALLMETPSVATTAGSIKDLHKNSNFLISEPDEDKIYENVKKIIIDKDAIKPDREYIVQNFSKKASTDKIMQVYAKIKPE